MNHRLLLLLTLTFIVTASPVSAEIYKWVDDKGVTHYGDKPKGGANNQGSSGKTEKMHLRGTKIYDEVKSLTPIPYSGTHEAPLILLNELVVKLKGSERRDVEIGTRTYAKWNSCIGPKPIMWSEGFISATDSGLMGAVVAPFDEAKYRMTGGNIINISSASGRLSLDATITRLKVDICHHSTAKYSQKAA